MDHFGRRRDAPGPSGAAPWYRRPIRSLTVAAITATALSLFHHLDATVMILIRNLGTAAILGPRSAAFSGGACSPRLRRPLLKPGTDGARTRRTSLKPALIVVAFSVGVIVAGSATRFGKERARWSALEALEAGFLVVVVLARIAGAFGLFPLLGGADPAAKSIISTS